ncbi:sugar porter family MFS transporter [Dysgonomonas termitidis]|uniref:Sugar porter family MFS transporter n=1 Tax=Dysgonomonas termitidis TaxID=1516126 RepID=A0ABV9L1N5_9BACT
MKKNNQSLFLYTFITVLGGLIFGLNMAGISGAIPFIREYFGLDDMTLGFVVSILTIGCLCGAIMGGRFGDQFGRKRVMLFSAILFIISSVGCSVSSGIYGLMIFRLIGGFGVGMISAVVPVYISEISPAKLRGTLVSYNQLAVVIGILIAYIVDYILLNNENNWRMMLGFPLIFSIVYILLLFILPESPRWLYMKGQTDKAGRTIEKLGLSKQEFDNVTPTGKAEKDGMQLKSLFKGKLAKILIIGSLLAAFQQITGINVIINYAPTIFEMTGVAGDTALIQSIYVGIVNLLFTLVAVWLVDRLGRKVLLLCGCAGMILSLLYLIYTFIVPSANGIGALIAVLCYIGFFAASLAPVMWVVTSEIYPSRIRGTAMSVSTGISWLCTFLTVQFFPWILNNLGGSIAFGIFAAFSVVAFIFILVYIPETKGKSLEQIEKELGLNE